MEEVIRYYQDETGEVGALGEGEELQVNIVFEKTEYCDIGFLEFLNSCGIEERKKQIYYILNGNHNEG